MRRKYPYYDKRGKLVYTVYRNANKTFPVYQSNGQPGYGSQGPILYRLPQLTKTPKREIVFICEGEKDTDNVRKLGFAATTNTGGAHRPWQEDYNPYFKNRRIVITPHNDSPGIKHANEIAHQLSSVAKEVRILPPFEGFKGKDISDWIGEGGTQKQLLRLVRGVEPLPMEQDPIDMILSRFDGMQPRSARDGWKGRWTAFCPLHEGDGQKHFPSLSIGLRDDGVIFLNCFAGCETSAILDEVELKTSDLFPSKQWKQYQFLLDQNGDALRFAVSYKDVFRYVIPWQKGNWLTYDGIRWNRDMKDAVASERAREMLRRLYQEASSCKDSEKQKQIAQWAIKANRSCSSHIRGILSLARYDPLIRLEEPEKLNSQDMLLNCRNGTVDLETGKLLEHNPADLITMTTATVYPTEIGQAPSVSAIRRNAPLWITCLDDWSQGNKSVKRYLQMIFGYALTGHILEKLFFLFIGKTNTGKSTCLDTITALMGDYAGIVPRTLFKEERFDRHPAEMAVIEHKRFMQVSEPESADGRLAMKTALAKALSGDHFLQVRGMGENFYTIRPTAKFVLSSNADPHIRSDDDAVWGRLRRLSWDYSVPAEKQNKHLFDDLVAEWPWILAWAVRGSMAWAKTGKIETPAVVQESTDAFRQRENPLYEFIHECTRLGGFTTTEKLHLQYEVWARDKHRSILSKVHFGRALKQLGYKARVCRVDGTKTRGWDVTLR